ncbi:GNAT family N-acetyltransferase [Devosia sp. XJ19-1]|uniref:GNAT family N-acetyltransferase n=1 Tax=Devosia ureilytica TaxID=2952754 RepID=A0A9Q4FUA1_9HYPH|nr:GNAT family N-acetyltransferase [Devosia ureilytica]MCP8888937.1 GNAT family N-acetyltransferase [Devosia ureilytica]
MALRTVEAFERAGLLAWPGIAVQWDGGWVCRSANGYTKRANSLQCFDPEDNADAAARLDRAVAWFAAQGLTPVVRTTPLESPALTAAIDARNWQTVGRSHLFAMSLEPHDPDPEGQTMPLLDPRFRAAQQALQGYEAAHLDRMQALLAVMSVPACGIVVYRDAVPAASGLMAIADGVVVAGNVITDPARRRQGLGAAMMRTGLAWARENGASTAALNVEADNFAGQALYRSLGYAHQYDYSYRIPGDAP